MASGWLMYCDAEGVGKSENPSWLRGFCSIPHTVESAGVFCSAQPAFWP